MATTLSGTAAILQNSSFTQAQSFLIERAIAAMSMWTWKKFDSQSFQHSIVQEWIDKDICALREHCDQNIAELTEAVATKEEYKKESKHFVLQIEQGSHMIAIADRTSAGSGTAVNHTEINILQLLAILEEYRLTTQSSTTAADICTILKI